MVELEPEVSETPDECSVPADKHLPIFGATSKRNEVLLKLEAQLHRDGGLHQSMRRRYKEVLCRTASSPMFRGGQKTIKQ